ncbi:MAG: substrate-binding domain-containing protein, partial [Actinomycetota bacterium]
MLSLRARPKTWAFLVLLTALLLPAPQGHAGRPAPVPLVGTGSWGVDPEMADWAAALAKAPSPVALTYRPQSTATARAAFLRGEADFVVSGVDFTRDERTQLERAGREVLRIPLQGAALAVLLRPPADGLAPSGAGPPVPYRGPVRMPPSTLARSVLSGANAWDDAELTQATGASLRPVPARLEPVLRSDATDASHYLALYLRTASPELWKA